ncbi:mucin-5AC [Diachasma alloeum]|uniref:mucin-5AC n=1 Tax=Diachasma alloeum TaxID=454923 RepID=UPI0007383D97|nr:mucin-5AC [Diachasma alloeum]
MDVSFTNVLEGARQYFQGLPAPSTTTSSDNRIYDEQSTVPQSTQNLSTIDSRTETRYNDTNKLDTQRDNSQIAESYWSTSNELRTIEPYPPQPTRVEVPDTRPDESGECAGSPATSLTEMQPPSRPHSTNRQLTEQLHNNSPKSHSPPPVYQQLSSVTRPSSYRSTTDMLNSNNHSNYQSNERPPSAPVAQRTQYYPRYHHPDITKSAPAPFSQNSIYQAPTPQASINPSATQPPTRTSPIEDNGRNSQQDSAAYSVPSASTPMYPAGNYRPTTTNRPADPMHSSSSTSSNSNPCSPRHAQTSHIPSPHSHPGHIPSPHLPVPSVVPPSSLSSSHALSVQNQHTSRLTPTHQNPYANRVAIPYTGANHNQQMLPPPSPSYSLGTSHESTSRHASSPQRQSPHIAVHTGHPISPHHHTSSPHNTTNFQPHSPTYPPPPLPARPSSNPYGLPPTSQQHRPVYPSGYPQSSYHSYQKTNQGYPQTSRSYTQLPVAGPSPTQSPTLTPTSASPTNDVNGSYLNSPSKLTYNGTDPKGAPVPVSQSNSFTGYRMPVSASRNANTHNLPITAVSSYHSNRNSRDAMGKAQALPRQRPAANSITVPSVPTVPRAPEFNPMTSAVNERLPVTTSASANYSYSGQQNYRAYATTVAPSHHSSSSTTTVTSIVNDTRPTQPYAVTVHSRSSSDSSRPPPFSQRVDSYNYKEYPYTNSSSQPMSRVSSTPPPQANGVPIRKRESPLDLSVKTVKTSADSTARDDLEVSGDKQVSSSSVVNSRRMLPPTQPCAGYANYERNANGRSSVPTLRPATPQMPVCAPKVDFLPDFNSTPLRHHHPSQPNHQPESDLRRTSSQQLYVPPQHQNTISNVPLPRMSTFKKSSLPSTPLYDGKSGLTSYPAMNEAARPPMRYPVEPTRPQGPSAYPSETSKYYPESRGKLPAKRPGDPLYMASGSGPSKHPRIDHWKLAIDKEIQQRLTAAQMLREQQQKRQENTQPTSMTNGTLVTPSYPPRTDNSGRYPSAFCDKRNYSESKVPTVLYTQLHSKPGSQVPGHQLSSAHQAAYPQGYRQGQRTPYSQPVDLPSNTGADKRVLSLLRNSLENKQQREEQMNSQQPILVNHSQQSFQNKVVAPVEPKTNIGRHNLSPFTAASLLERNSNTPPHYKFHVPRAVDSITQEIPRSLYGSRVNSSATLPAGKEALLGPRDENQIHRDKDDSLAAMIAAKIRTKAELKQVGTGQLSSKSVLGLSQEPHDLERAASTSTPQSVASSAGSPPKLTREKTPCLPSRRRLFSRSDEDNLPVAATIPTPASITPAASVVSRNSGFRSSSETSVFDFRESDSETEMPVLERQTLEEMRRDRKQLSKVQPPVPLNDTMCLGIGSSDLVKIELKENDKITELDPFWTTTCDKFMEQLRTGENSKKRGRRKKVGEPEDDSREGHSREIEIKPENIKKEINDDESVSTKPDKDVKETESTKTESESSFKPDASIKKEQVEEPEVPEEEGSDNDSDELPLIKRASKKKKTEDSDDDDIIPNKRSMRRGSRIKLASSSESSSSSGEDSDGSNEFGGTSVAHRLRNRKRSGVGEAEGMKLRSREMGPQKTKDKDSKSPKSNSVQKPKPKPLFGDGSDFRPGWEEEVYVYKKSLRMPPRLINVSKPSRFHRLSTSLPDLDPGSPALSVSMDSSDVCLQKRSNDSDVESNYSFSAGLSKIDDEEATSSTTMSVPSKTNTRARRSESNSIVDLLARKVGGNKKDQKKKSKDLKSGSKILPKGSNEPELLPTPSLTPLIGNETPKTPGKSPAKNNKSVKPINVTDSYLLGYFRKETVNNFRDTFKNNYALPNEFSTFVLKTRTRTETRVLKKQATIREVFGEDRPASAPPMQNHAGDTSQDDDSQTETKESILGRTKTLKQKVVSRLRNVGILRSHKAVMNSKRHLLTVQRRNLMKSLAEKKIKNIKKEVKEEPVEDGEPEEEVNEGNNEGVEAQGKKKLKLRTGRRKFRSGFDYIRKKKKPLKKEEGAPKERKRQPPVRPNAECVADIQAEIRTWVIKKGVGETVLHRAARLGYTDVAAYCLEKLNSPPSPKDNAGYTPLHEACSRGHLQIAKLLLAYGANVSESANGGIRPLHEAAENGATELVRLLLSYGADPVLATYSGQTPLMLAVDTDAYPIIEQHLDDVQGRSSTPWSFSGPSSIFDDEETGYDALLEAPSPTPEPEPEELEVEMSEVNLPVLFTLTNDPDKWVLLQDLMSAVRVKSRDALLRQINPKAPSGPPVVAHREVMRELKLHDFLEQSRCCHLLSAGERINVRASKVTLIKYNDKVRSLLNVERVVINLR